MKPILFKTDNSYLYSPEKNQFLLLNPILYEIIEKKQNGDSDEEILQSLTEHNNIPAMFHDSSIDRVKYYFNKYYLLENSGYFDSYNVEKHICLRHSAKDIEVALTNTVLIIFEVTDKCNLNCKYCTFGKFYNNYDSRENKNMSFNTAKNFLDYFLEKRNSLLNKSFKKKTRINFYGGEPLLNIDLIKQIIHYIDEKGASSLFDYGITTNGTLLKKHINYLVEKNFDMVVSIDGDEECNSYRTFKNGKPTFKAVTDNLNYIKNNYPDFFEKQIKFNSVYHNKSNVEIVNKYFKSTFGRIPMMTELDPNGVNPLKSMEFENIHKTIQEDLDILPENNQIINELKFSNPYTEGLRQIFLSSLYCGTLSWLRVPDTPSKVPTATCLPFSRSAHITVNGKIFLCERTGHDNCLGNFSECADLDFQNVADIINKRFDDLKNQCKNCYMVYWCNQCAMVIDSIKGEIKCPDFINYQETVSYMSKLFVFFEKNPDIYPETMLNN